MKNLTTILIEGPIIIVSVFGGFVLEDYRSTEFEKKQTKELLISLEAQISKDSSNIWMYLDPNNIEKDGPYGLLLRQQEKGEYALHLLDYGNEDSTYKAFNLYRENEILFFLPSGYVPVPFELEILQENYWHHLDPATKGGLTEYFKVIRDLNSYCDDADQELRHLYQFQLDNFYTLSENVDRLEALKFAKTPTFYNSIIAMRGNYRNYQANGDFLINWFLPDLRKSMREEINRL